MASFRSTLRAEDGFSLIELLAALTILLIGILGVAASLDRTRDVVTTAEVRETAVHRAQRELERVRALPWAQLGLNAMPTAVASQADPAFYVQGGRYQWDAQNPSNVADLVAPPTFTGGTITPRTTWNDGRMSGSLQVYVTTFDDTVTPDPSITANPRARRVVVGVTVNGRWALSRPTMVSTVVHEPPPVTP